MFRSEEFRMMPSTPSLSPPRRVVLLGGPGAVGGPLSELLRGHGLEVVQVSRHGSTPLDLERSPESLSQVSRGAALVINAMGTEAPTIAQHSRAPFLDISATPSYLLTLAHTPPVAGVIIGVGLAPGLTTLLAREVSTGPDDEVDVALILGVGEHHGPAARAWTARLLGGSFDSPLDGGLVRNFTQARALAIPGRGRRRVVRADFPDGSFPTQAGARVRSYLGLTSRAATLALSAATYAPRMLGPALSLPLPGSSDWAITANSRTSGLSASARGTGQSTATAELTALTVMKALGRREQSGVRFMADLVSLTDVAALASIEHVTA